MEDEENRRWCGFMYYDSNNYADIMRVCLLYAYLNERTRLRLARLPWIINSQSNVANANLVILTMYAWFAVVKIVKSFSPHRLQPSQQSGDTFGVFPLRCESLLFHCGCQLFPVMLTRSVFRSARLAGKARSTVARTSIVLIPLIQTMAGKSNQYSL